MKQPIYSSQFMELYIDIQSSNDLTVEEYKKLEKLIFAKGLLKENSINIPKTIEKKSIIPRMVFPKIFEKKEPIKQDIPSRSNDKIADIAFNDNMKAEDRIAMIKRML